MTKAHKGWDQPDKIICINKLIVAIRHHINFVTKKLISKTSQEIHALPKAFYNLILRIRFLPNRSMITFLNPDPFPLWKQQQQIQIGNCISWTGDLSDLETRIWKEIERLN